MIKSGRILALALLLAMALSLSAPGLRPAYAESAGEPLLLTLEELKAFDGKDGRPAYVAVDGIIYDVTNSIPWKNGEHNGFSAGNDLTREIKEISPHGAGKLQNVVEIGRVRLELTLDELKAFDGKDGRPAYVAVDGIIYDVTNSIPWKNGEHSGFSAGNDLTREIKEISPHGVGKLQNVVEIGRIKLELTLEQLKEFDGMDGRPAYIAANGILYDVSAHPSWQGGEHAGIKAGQDVTEALNASPHGEGVLSQVDKIGILIP